ncbi:hypothetical protein KR093_002023 [Drosophila rubida]|uniref:acid phosphatase n=1 Tax=Drosophila rubida TaxID=30044 RepID=A0AAD4PH85_9MUSC|nr:hypothetical protein KR093_002023 [Drosophila rubida]
MVLKHPSQSIELTAIAGIGNSCSSPMAEAIMQNLMVKTSLYWEIDSAALRTWNIGRKPHKQCLKVLREHGLRSDHFCRLLTVHDFSYFDFIIAMNEHVHKELMHWANGNHIQDTSHVVMLGTFGKNGKIISVIDLSPTRKLKAFRSAYYQIKDCCKQLILSQHVKIVRYDLPSTEEEDERKMNLTRSPESSKSLTEGSVDFPKRYPSRTSCATSCSLSNYREKKLCDNCGQRFLATL